MATPENPAPFGDPDLDGLWAKIRQARREGRLPEQNTRAEKIGWVLGNMNASTRHQTTREAVERALDKLEEEKKEAARARLLAALPHIHLAMNFAQVNEPQGTILLAIISKKPDGSGRVGATFDGGIIADVVTVLGFENIHALVEAEDALAATTPKESHP